MTTDPAAAPSANLQAAHRRATIIAGAMIGSLFVYAIVVEVLSRSNLFEVNAAVPEVVRWAFYAVAVSMVFASHVVKAFMMRGFAAASEEEVLARLTTSHVVAGALSETPAVLGLVLFVIARQHSDFYFLALISLYLLFRHFPRLGSWERAVRQYAPKG